MSGFDVACDAQRVFPNIKVLFTTGYTENALNHQNRLREGTHLLPKPYTKEDLARKLRSLLDTD
jgi:two-component SAPR family response regulator